jgi:hypothetical protein
MAAMLRDAGFTGVSVTETAGRRQVAVGLRSG